MPLPADWPDWIVGRDPDGWAGNYPVAYWDPAWKDVVIYGENTGSRPDRAYVSILDEVVRAGFDGVYLDWVEAYEDASVQAASEANGIDDLPGEMIAFIGEIRDWARARNPDFIVLQQNASTLLFGGDTEVYRPELAEVIDGIAQEEVWFAGDATDSWNDPSGYDTPVDSDLTAEYLENLAAYIDEGLPVFNCEYALTRAADAYSWSSQRGFRAYCTRRSLSRLTTTPPPGL